MSVALITLAKLACVLIASVLTAYVGVSIALGVISGVVGFVLGTVVITVLFILAVAYDLIANVILFRYPPRFEAVRSVFDVNPGRSDAAEKKRWRRLVSEILLRCVVHLPRFTLRRLARSSPAHSRRNRGTSRH